MTSRAYGLSLLTPNFANFMWQFYMLTFSCDETVTVKACINWS
jgi:hypothetical protein